MNSKIAVRVALSAGLVLWPLIRLDAQQPTPEPPARFDTDVVVTATRSEVAVDHAPVATTTVTGDEMRLRRVPTLDQSLNLLPGVYVFRAKGLADPGARVTLRGFSGANRTLVLVDGLPLNDAYTGELMWSSLPMGDVDRVEVARGPFSALYGGNAMGGVIHVLSKRPDRRALSARAQYGTYGTGNAGVDMSSRIGRGFGVSLGVQAQTTDGYRSRLITVSPGTGSAGVAAEGASRTMTTTGLPAFAIGEGGAGWQRQVGGYAAVEWTPRPGSFWSARYAPQHLSYGFGRAASFVRSPTGALLDRGPVIVNDAGVMTQLSFTPGTFLQSPGDARAHVAGVTGRQQRGGYVIEGRGGISAQPDNRTRTPAVATATEDGGPGATSVRDSRSYFAGVQASRAAGTAELLGGVDYRREWSDNREHALADWTDRERVGAQTFQSHGDTASAAAYAQVRVPMGSRVGVTAGARFDHWRTFDGVTDIFNAAVPRTAYGDRSHRSVTGRAAVVVQPSAAWTIRSGIGSAFRAPTVFELYRTFRLSSGTIFHAAPDLEPERNVGIELGARRRLGSRGEIDAAYFRNRTSNLVYRKNDLASDPTGRTRVLVNAGEGVSHGVEVSTRWRVFSAVDLRAQYSGTAATIRRNPALPETEGKRVPFVPDHMAAVSALIVRGPWNAALSWRYVSATFSLDTNADVVKGVMGSYGASSSIDGTAGYRLSRNVELYVSVENVANRRDFVFYRTPGRTLNAGVVFRSR